MLTEFDFAADPGTTTALVGPSGGGNQLPDSALLRARRGDGDAGRDRPREAGLELAQAPRPRRAGTDAVRAIHQENIAYGLEELDAGEREREGAAGPEPEGGALPLPASRRHPPLGGSPELAARRAALGHAKDGGDDRVPSSSPPSEA